MQIKSEKRFTKLIWSKQTFFFELILHYLTVNSASWHLDLLAGVCLVPPEQELLLLATQVPVAHARQVRGGPVTGKETVSQEYKRTKTVWLKCQIIKISEKQSYDSFLRILNRIFGSIIQKEKNNSPLFMIQKKRSGSDS
jgi:hypothetical protein